MTRHTSSTTVPSASPLRLIQKEKWSDSLQSKASTYSPLSSVKGYDRTRIPRLSVEEYRKELASEACLRHGQGQEQPVGKGSRTKQDIQAAFPVSPLMTSEDIPSSGGSFRSVGGHKKSLLRGSRFPFHTTFSSKYPVYDRLGHELCVLYQMHEVDVASEVHRIRSTMQGRQTGVRRSTALLVETTRESQEEHTGKARREGWEDAKNACDSSKNDEEEQKRHAERTSTTDTIAERERRTPEAEPSPSHASGEREDTWEVKECRHEGNLFASASRANSGPSASVASRSCSRYRLPSVFSIFKESRSVTESPVPMRHRTPPGSPRVSRREQQRDTIAGGKEIRWVTSFQPEHLSEHHVDASMEEGKATDFYSTGTPVGYPERLLGAKTRRADSTTIERGDDAPFVVAPPMARVSGSSPTLERLASSGVTPFAPSQDRHPYPHLIDIQPLWCRASVLHASTATTTTTKERGGMARRGRHSSCVEDGIPYRLVAAAVEKNFRAAFETIQERPHQPRPHTASRSTTASGMAMASLSVWDMERITARSIRHPCTWPTPVGQGAMLDPRHPTQDGSAPRCRLETAKEPRRTAAVGESSSLCVTPSSPLSSSNPFLPPPLPRGLPWRAGSILPLAEGTQLYRLEEALSPHARLAHGLAVGDVWRATRLSPGMDSLPSTSTDAWALEGGARVSSTAPMAGENPHRREGSYAGRMTQEDTVVHLLYPWRFPASIATSSDCERVAIETFRSGVGLEVCSASRVTSVRGFHIHVGPPSLSMREASEEKNTEEAWEQGANAGDVWPTAAHPAHETAVRGPPPFPASASSPEEREEEEIDDHASLSSSSVPPPFVGTSVPEKNAQDTIGVTMFSLPPHYQALPVRVLSLSGRAFQELFRLTLQTASALLSKRLLHGSLENLDHLWIAFPIPSTEGSTRPARAVGASHTLLDMEAACSVEVEERQCRVLTEEPLSLISSTVSSSAPFLLPLHWERCVDFRMFSDRRVGKEIPIVWDVVESTSRASSSVPRWKEGNTKANCEEKDEQEEAEPKKDEESLFATVLATPIPPPCTTVSPLRYSSDLHVLLNELLAMRESRELKGEVFFAARALLSRTSDPSVPLSVLLLQLNALLSLLSLSSSRRSPSATKVSPARSSATASPVMDASSFPPEDVEEWAALREACGKAWNQWHDAKEKEE